MKFRKKPVIIEAVLWVGKAKDLEAFTSVDNWVPKDSPFILRYDELYIKTLEGEMHVSHGDWIIKGVKGEFYPCKPDIFESTYEKV